MAGVIPIAAVLDRLIDAAARRAASPGDIRFTADQLYYETARSLTAPLTGLLPKRLPVIGGGIPGFTVPAAVPRSAFDELLDRSPDRPGLLGEPDVRPSVLGRFTVEPDLFDYGLPRLLICQSQDIAAMLRVNGIELDSACPVLGPAELDLLSPLLTMLNRATDSGVYVLHDASAAGGEFVTRMRRRVAADFTGRYLPIGLADRHITQLRLPRRPDVAGAREVEVSAVPPAVLLRSVHRLVRGVRLRRTAAFEFTGPRRAGFLTWPTE